MNELHIFLLHADTLIQGSKGNYLQTSLCLFYITTAQNNTQILHYNGLMIWYKLQRLIMHSFLLLKEVWLKSTCYGNWIWGCNSHLPVFPKYALKVPFELNNINIGGDVNARGWSIEALLKHKVLNLINCCWWKRDIICSGDAKDATNKKASKLDFWQREGAFQTIIFTFYGFSFYFQLKHHIKVPFWKNLRKKEKTEVRRVGCRPCRTLQDTIYNIYTLRPVSGQLGSLIVFWLDVEIASRWGKLCGWKWYKLLCGFGFDLVV